MQAQRDIAYTPVSATSPQKKRMALEVEDDEEKGGDFRARIRS